MQVPAYPMRHWGLKRQGQGISIWAVRDLGAARWRVAASLICTTEIGVAHLGSVADVLQQTGSGVCSHTLRV